MVDSKGISLKLGARIKKELDDFNKNTMGATVMMIDEKDPVKWNVFFPGASGSVYEGGTFQLEIIFAKTYPFNAPFVTKN